MKILHYYWTQFDDEFRKGGGVKVYLNNIISYQLSMGNEVFMLNSGVEYTLLKRKCFIRKIKAKENLKQFSIVNSPVMAPSKADFYGQKEYLENKELAQIIQKFLIKYGPFDVIHFHSLEGISISVLELKKIFPYTKFFYTVHNYFPFCSQVNLWKNDIENCRDYCNGKDCIYCIGSVPKRNKIRWYYSLVTIFEKMHMEGSLNLLMRCAQTYHRKMYKNHCKSYIKDDSFDKLSKIELAQFFRDFREINVQYFNNYFDKIICVSHRVKSICHMMGIKEELLYTLYIGTDFSLNQHLKPAYEMQDTVFQIAYIGYMRRDKGFYFFMDALDQMKKEMASKISLIIAARNEDEEVVKRLEEFKKKFYSIKYYDGYTRQNIRNILRETQLGVVPIMWEDNLPQVAMELKAMGIPVLSSNLGGASELTDSQYFKFLAGNTNDFIDKIYYIMTHKEVLKEYFDKGKPLISIKEHCEQLDNLYK